jgi:hypothetical protein
MSCLKFNEKGTYLTIRKLAEGYLKEREKEVTKRILSCQADLFLRDLYLNVWADPDHVFSEERKEKEKNPTTNKILVKQKSGLHDPLFSMMPTS